jgi:hypothetical protein
VSDLRSQLLGHPGMLYDDGKIACEDATLIIRRYYRWGAKRIPPSSAS